MTARRSGLVLIAALAFPPFIAACSKASSPPRRAVAQPIEDRGITPIDAKDTAAYAAAGPEAVAAVSRCHPPACRPDIFRGPQPGELTVGLDSAGTARESEYQWHVVPDSAPRGQAFQDSAWTAMLTRWEAERPQRLLLVDSIPRSFAYARQHLRLSAIWGMQELSAAQAKALWTDPAAAHGAIMIVTKAHAPPPAR